MSKLLNIAFCLCTDVISIEKTGENFRLLFDVKGRFTVHRISPEESSVCCVKGVCVCAEKAMIFCVCVL